MHPPRSLCGAEDDGKKILEGRSPCLSISKKRFHERDRHRRAAHLDARVRRDRATLISQRRRASQSRPELGYRGGCSDRTLLVERITARYPDHGILGEEQTRQGLDREFLWALDPLDGTALFVAGLPTWGISAGLLRHGAPYFGMIYFPLLDDCYWAGPNRQRHAQRSANPRSAAAPAG